MLPPALAIYRGVVPRLLLRSSSGASQLRTLTATPPQANKPQPDPIQPKPPHNVSHPNMMSSKPEQTNITHQPEMVPKPDFHVCKSIRLRSLSILFGLSLPWAHLSSPYKPSGPTRRHAWSRRAFMHRQCSCMSHAFQVPRDEPCLGFLKAATCRGWTPATWSLSLLHCVILIAQGAKNANDKIKSCTM